MQSPCRFSNAQSGVRGRAGRQGEHNREVLEDWLGWPADEIDALTGGGALKTPETGDAETWTERSLD